MSIQASILRAVAVVVVLAMETFAGDKVLLEWNFDGDAGNDIGPAIIGRGWAVAGDPLTGELHTTANNTDSGFVADAHVDASGADWFSITWTVSSFTTNTSGYVHHEGHTYGVSKGNAANWRKAGSWPSLAFAIDGGSSGAGDWKFVEYDTNGVQTVTALAGSPATYNSISDGFTITLKVDSDDTWEVSTTGLSNTETNTGTLSGNVTYAEIASNLYPNCVIGGYTLDATVDHVVLSSFTTPAGTVIMIR